jgi:hypothetical protein
MPCLSCHVCHTPQVERKTTSDTPPLVGTRQGKVSKKSTFSPSKALTTLIFLP